MDVETFLEEAREVSLSKELQDLDATKMQTTTWVQFKVEIEGEDGSALKSMRLRKHSINR